MRRSSTSVAPAGSGLKAAGATLGDLLAPAPNATLIDLVLPAQLGQARALLAAVRGTRLERIVTIALCLGLRQGEALGLTWADIDLDAGIVQVRRALKRIDGQLRLDELKTRRSRRNLPCNLTRDFDRLLAEAKLPDVRWHDLCHSAGSLL